MFEFRWLRRAILATGDEFFFVAVGLDPGQQSGYHPV
jgi:hypothetical protein